MNEYIIHVQEEINGEITDVAEIKIKAIDLATAYTIAIDSLNLGCVWIEEQ
ncbi:MAG: hypothetical protein ACRCYD_05910 [Plesiomonas sp.]